MAEVFTPLTLASLTNQTSAINTINTNFSTLATLLNDVVSRSNVSPNVMLANLDMNSNRLLNLPAPSSSTEAARLLDITSLAGGSLTITGLTGPPSSTNNAIARYSGTSGTILKNSLVTIDDLGNVNIRATTLGSVPLVVQGTASQVTGAFFQNGDFVNGTTGSGFYLQTGAITGNTYSYLQSFISGNSASGNFVINPFGGTVLVGGTTNKGSGPLGVNAGTIATFPASSMGYTPIGAYVQIVSDNQMETGITQTGQNLPSAFYVEHNFGGANINTGRNALSVLLNQTASSSPTNPYKFFVASVFQAQSFTTEGGGLGTEVGVTEAVTGVAILGGTATHFLAAVGAEFNISIQTGASLKNKAVLMLGLWPTDSVAGSQIDTFIDCWADTGAAGVTTVIDVNNFAGAIPLRSTGAIIKARGGWTTATGFDFNGISFSGNVMQWNGGLFFIQNNGNVTLGGIIGSDFPLSGSGHSLTTTQTQSNTTDTGDTALFVNYIMNANTATNELISRSLKLNYTNNLLGGGIISNARILEITPITNASTTTTSLECIFLGGGTPNGTVTTGMGLHISAIQGTTKWGIADDSGSNWYNLTGGLSLGSNSSAGNGNLLVSNTAQVGTLRIQQTPTAVTHTVTITAAADSATNFGHVLTVNMNGTTYFIPCGTVQP